MPYLRYIGSKNEYGVIPFPVMGILYGESNGEKSTFINLLSKLMAGVKVTANSSNDFTGTNISNLKAACEGPALECQVTSRSLVMKLDVAMSIFGTKFRKGILV